MSISELMPVSEPVRRIELFTGHGRRRAWSDDEKAAIVSESYEGGESVCSVARRHGLTPQQLFTWRRAARKAAATAVTFAPVVIAPSPKMTTPEPTPPHRPSRKRRAAAAIELEAGGVTVRVADGASSEAIAAVIRALKAST